MAASRINRRGAPDSLTPGVWQAIFRGGLGAGRHARVISYHSIHGDIISEWRIEKGIFRLNVTVPPGTTATVFLPGKAGVEVVAGAHSFEAAL